MDPMVIGILVVVTLLLAYTLYLVMQKPQHHMPYLPAIPVKPAPVNPPVLPPMPGPVMPGPVLPPIMPGPVLPPVTKKASMQVGMQAPIPSLIPSSMQAPSQAWMTDSTQMQAMPHKYMGECDSSRDCPMFQHCNAVGNCTSNESCRY